MFIPCAVKYALCFYAGCQFYRAFFLSVLNTIIFGGFSFGAKQRWLESRIGVIIVFLALSYIVCLIVMR